MPKGANRRQIARAAPPFYGAFNEANGGAVRVRLVFEDEFTIGRWQTLQHVREIFFRNGGLPA